MSKGLKVQELMKLKYANIYFGRLAVVGDYEKRLWANGCNVSMVLSLIALHSRYPYRNFSTATT